MSSDREYMRLALKLGAKGKGSTFPNPPVGAVIVKDSEIIGRGWHSRRGEAHAEVRAIADAEVNHKDTSGATMFVTLEPCCHHGITPPCTEAIIAAGISRVVVSCRDDCDERVCGMGIARSQEAGLKVETGILNEEGRELIEQYVVQRKKKRAFLSAKWAQSLDGRIATKSGKSKWITNERSRKYAHLLRSQHGAVAVGAKTAMLDDPELTVRMVRSHHTPARIIIAGDSKLPSSIKLLSGGPRTIVVHSDTNPVSGDVLDKVEFLKIPSGPRFWEKLLQKLPHMDIGSVLLEGGSETLTSAFKAGAVDRIYCFIAPKIIGEGIEAIGDLGIDKLDKSLRLDNVRRLKLGDDVLITGRIRRT